MSEEQLFTSRISDVEVAPQHLPPISGWQDAPLKAIEDSVRDLGVPYATDGAMVATMTKRSTHID